ncbi:phosphoribosylaminoimidazolesuccinocarboxamide synthase [Microlunatus speluncae]|uniref:phosphoribosylaminoimidazolesuccinocarboxamide synthase n=1 Tax=Microlunatus speluncae TaxID=2594267 RepID=UPI00126688D8|nr:phosphoribosylaminoimidazolesuccinocarboxamide synthase [Microlunatus speluncae]
MPVLHSTKDLHILDEPTSNGPGVGAFDYTDHYTVFHYGRMPDAIPGKGEASAQMAARTFELLTKAGILTHFRRFRPPNRIEFDLGHVPAPGSSPPAGLRLLPVQVIFRNRLPQGSSVHRRLADGAITPADLGLDTVPGVGEALPRPIIEYASMFDDTNQFLTPARAQHLTGLNDEQFQTLGSTAAAVNEVLTAHARERGLDHCDGKAEFLITGKGSLMVADSPGTPDESRLMFRGVHCGKQVLRNWYVDNNLAVPVTDLIARGVPRDRWPRPAPLPSEFLPVMSNMYRALSRTWTDQDDGDGPNLTDATQAVTRLIGC